MCKTVRIKKNPELEIGISISNKIVKSFLPSKIIPTSNYNETYSKELTETNGRIKQNTEQALLI